MNPAATLASSYAGLAIRSPVVIGSCPLTLDTARVVEFADAGAGAIVMPSIFEEQISQDQLGFVAYPPLHIASGETLSISAPDLDRYNGGTEQYIRTIECHKNACSVPIIASINCVSGDSWAEYGNRLAAAGADAIELNLFHYEVDPERFAEDVERELLARVRYAVEATGLPVSAKLLPQFTCLANFAYRVAGAGAKSVCLFGQAPAFEPRHQEKVHRHWRLTNHADLRASLDAVHQVHTAVHNLTIGASGGIQDPDDAIAAIQLGANVVMLTSAIYKQGSVVIEDICRAVEAELDRHDMVGLDELVGSQFSGYDPFPERTRRQQYNSSVTKLSNGQEDV